jgi:hypothetical protein
MVATIASRYTEPDQRVRRRSGAKGRCKPDGEARMPGAGLSAGPCGKARPDRLALKPYWENRCTEFLGEAMETPASFEARSAPSPYPTATAAPRKEHAGPYSTRRRCRSMMHAAHGRLHSAARAGLVGPPPLAGAARPSRGAPSSSRPTHSSTASSSTCAPPASSGSATSASSPPAVRRPAIARAPAGSSRPRP